MSCNGVFLQCGISTFTSVKDLLLPVLRNACSPSSHHVWCLITYCICLRLHTHTHTHFMQVGVSVSGSGLYTCLHHSEGRLSPLWWSCVTVGLIQTLQTTFSRIKEGRGYQGSGQRSLTACSEVFRSKSR